MIEWKYVDAGILLWSLFDAALVAASVGLIVYLVRLRRRDKEAAATRRMIEAVAKYDKRTGSRGAVKALISKI